jgi:hypothetical protein
MDGVATRGRCYLVLRVITVHRLLGTNPFIGSLTKRGGYAERDT